MWSVRTYDHPSAHFFSKTRDQQETGRSLRISKGVASEIQQTIMALALRKLTARVFGAGPGVGGNPVTIFLNNDSNCSISANAEETLARSCEWESVLIQRDTITNNSIFKFFVPSGNEMSFCAHAAMGAAYAIRGDAATTIPFSTSDGSSQTARIEDDGTVFLNLNRVSYGETNISLLHAESLMDQVGLEMMHVMNLPINAAIAGRPKTLIQVPLDILQAEARNPSSPKSFKDNCFMAHESSGLYLFAQDDNDVLECRQFPNASGYPEDPATGIAAAALAVHLNKKNGRKGSYDIRQGTVMGRPSQILIQDIVRHDDNDNSVSMQCGGRVEIDSEEEIRV